MTGTVIVQEPLAGIPPPLKVTVALPAAADKVPPQVVLPEPETTTPDGKLSVSGAVSFAIVASGLVKVIVTVEAVPAFTVVGLKALLSEGARAPQRTVRVATAGELLLPLLVCSAPAASELK